MARKKISTTIYITPEQNERLKLLNEKTKVPVAEYIRQGIDLVLEKYRGPPPRTAHARGRGREEVGFHGMSGKRAVDPRRRPDSSAPTSCDRLLGEALARSSGVDNLVTGTRRNLAHVAREPRFDLVEADICEPLDLDGPLDDVFNFASPASPIDYAELPLETLRVGSIGHRERARAREAQGRDLPPGLDLRGVRRPARAPADGELLGEREPDRPARRSTTRRSATPRRSPWRTAARRGGRCASPASSTPTARACGSTTGAWCRPSSPRRSAGEHFTVFGDGSPDAQLLLRGGPGGRPLAPRSTRRTRTR